MGRRSALAAVAICAGLVALPRFVGAQDTAGFDGYVQSGSCASPSEDLRANLKSEGAHDVEPYYAAEGDSDSPTLLGYYGAPGLPGFGFANIYTDRSYSLVITDTEDGSTVACGDILRPDADRFAEAGLALVQLLPTGDSAVQGVAAIERSPLRREEDTTPTRVRIVLSEGLAPGPAAMPADGYDGYVRAGGCDDSNDKLRIELKARGDHDVRPYTAQPEGSGRPITIAYYGAPRVPGFNLAAAHTDHEFALVLDDSASGTPVACGEILVPDDDDFVESGLAIVQLAPSGDAGVPGFAVFQRIARERELDITPTRARIIMFAPPSDTSG
jgi:hypothetical protein